MARASLCVAAKGSRCPKPSHLSLGRAGFVSRFFPNCFVRGRVFAPGAARLWQAIVSASFHSTLVVWRHLALALGRTYWRTTVVSVVLLCARTASWTISSSCT